MFSNEELVTSNIATVRKIYSTAVPLLDYVTSLTNSDKASIVKGDDTSKFVNFILTTVVVPLEGRNSVDVLSLCKIRQESSAYKLRNKEDFKLSEEPDGSHETVRTSFVKY